MREWVFSDGLLIRNDLEPRITWSLLFSILKQTRTKKGITTLSQAGTTVLRPAHTGRVAVQHSAKNDKLSIICTVLHCV